MEIKVGEFYKTRGGDKAEVVYEFKQNTNEFYVFIVVIHKSNGAQYEITVTRDGLYFNGKTDCDDLVAPWPKKVKVEGWLNVDADGSATFWNDLGLANICADEDRIACVRIDMEVEDGEGL